MKIIFHTSYDLTFVLFLYTFDNVDNFCTKNTQVFTCFVSIPDCSKEVSAIGYFTWY